MKIAVIGGGAIGSVVAGYLAKAGEDVLLVGRKEHVDAIHQKGLVIKTAEGEDIIPLRAAEGLDQEYDLVIFTVKTQDLEEAYQSNCKYLENCICMTTQNGVQGSNLLSSHFDQEKMIESIIMFGATFIRPGEVTFNFEGNWIMGKPYVKNDSRMNGIADVLRKGFSVVVSDNIMGMKWLKLFVNFNNCIPALIGKSMQETFSDMDFCKLSIILLKEGIHIIQEAGIELVSMPNFPAERIIGLSQMPVDQGAGIINKTLTTLSKEPLYGSILQSIMRGRTSEIDFINGEINQVASGIQTRAPLNRKIVNMVHQVEMSGKYFDPEEVKKEFQL